MSCGKSLGNTEVYIGIAKPSIFNTPTQLWYKGTKSAALCEVDLQ